MRIKKLYFSRTYNQWKGEPLFVEDGLENSCLYVRMLDVNFDKGAVNVVTAEFKDLNGYVHPILAECDYAKKLAIFKIPLAILSNNGIYEVGFSISYNAVSDTNLRAQETGRNLVCRRLLEKKKHKNRKTEHKNQQDKHSKLSYTINNRVPQ